MQHLSQATHLYLRLRTTGSNGNGRPLRAPKHDVVAVGSDGQRGAGGDAGAAADAARGVPPRLHFVVGEDKRRVCAYFGAQIVKELLNKKRKCDCRKME